VVDFECFAPQSFGERLISRLISGYHNRPHFDFPHSTSNAGDQDNQENIHQEA
jgi:hypothetical protein